MKNKHRAIILWLIVLTIVSCLIWYPVWWGIIRLGIVTGLVALWFGFIYIIWNYKAIKILCIIVTLSATTVLLPGNNGNPEKIRALYVEKLKTYDGVKYVWGGKNSRGIDCSGLVRKGYIDANVSLGIKTCNPKLLRRAFFVWWYDCAADALGEEYKNMTKKVRDAGSIAELEDIQQPGDLIVGLPDGFHVLAYLGNDQWIEADPTPGKVITISTSQKSEQWAGVLVRLVRWNDEL